MDARKMLKIVAITCCFVFCFAVTNAENISSNNNSQSNAEKGVLDKITSFFLNLSDATQQKFGQMKERMAALKDSEMYEKNIEKLQSAFKDSNFKLDIETLSKLENFFKNETIFGGFDTSEVIKLLKDRKTEMEESMKSDKNSNSGGKFFYGIISIIIPLFLTFLVEL